MLSLRVADALLLLLLSVPLGPAVQAQDQTPLVRSNTRLVLLDVVITGKDGHPVRGLNRGDLQVLEDGVPQKLVSFEEAPGSMAVAGRALSAARTLILLDELNIAFSDLAYARDRVSMYLDEAKSPMPPTTLMIVANSGLVTVQDYTQDKELLKTKLVNLPALNANSKGEGRDMNRTRDYAKTALTALSEIARSSVGLPYSLNVIWVTGGFPGLVQNPEESDRVDAGLREIANILIQSRMRLYTIDPTGVVPIMGKAAPPKITRGNIRDSHTSAAEQMENSTGAAEMTADQLLEHMTKIMGGRSFRGRNDLEVAIDEAVEDGSGSYLISYSPSDGNFHGEYRKIEVRANNSDYTARTRQGYYAIAEDAKTEAEGVEFRLEDALNSPIVYRALNVSCAMNFDPGKRHLVGEIGVTPIPGIMAEEREQLIRVAALSKDHKVVDKWVYRANWKESWTTRPVRAKIDKILSPKVTDVRFVVATAAADRIGSCDYPIPSS